MTDDSEPVPFVQFERVVRALLQVPKAEIDAEIARRRAGGNPTRDDRIKLDLSRQPPSEGMPDMAKTTTPATPTISVVANREALSAAVAALEDYETAQARHDQAIEKATEKRDASVATALQAFDLAVIKAGEDLAPAITTAQAAGVTFPAEMLNGHRPGSGLRRPKLTVEDVRAALPAGAPFTTGAIATKLDASNGTVSKILRGMVEAGELEDLGADPAQKTPGAKGRAPVSYRRAQEAPAI